MGAQHDGRLRCAPITFNAALRRQRQSAKPLHISAEGQHICQALRGQSSQRFRFIESAQGSLHLGGDLLGSGYLRLVTGRFHGGQHVMQTFGDV